MSLLRCKYVLKLHLNVIVEIHDEETLSSSSPTWQSEIPDVMGVLGGKRGNICLLYSPSLHYAPE